MTILFPGDAPHSALASAQSLAADLACLVASEQPSAGALASAPVIDWWLPAFRSSGAFIGKISGRPNITNGRTGVTSQLFVIDPAMGWARTWSRFYRLGRPAHQSERRQH
jgi:hypothetical protein